MLCNVNSVRCWLRIAVLLCFALIPWEGARAADKVIRLRNQAISTSSTAAKPPQTKAVNLPQSGLFIVQFTSGTMDEWKARLRSQGVEFIKYVPDDAFIVRLNGANLAAINQLPFVQWIGPYEKSFKVDSRILLGGLQLKNVRVLIDPFAGGVEIKRLRSIWPTVNRQTSSRFGLIWQGTISDAQLDRLAESEAVLWIETAPKIKMLDEISSKIVGGDNEQAGTRTITQQLGFTGKGVIVAVPDSGLDLGSSEDIHPDLAGRVEAFFFYDDLDSAADEHSHGTHVTGIIAGNAATGEMDEAGYLFGLGVAPEAGIVAQRIFDGAGNYKPPESSEQLTRDAVRSGAKIGSNSWGDDVQGRYDLSAAEFDALVRDADALSPGDQPFILEFSAGNAGPGPQTMDSPAVAKNVIATGASQNNRLEFFLYADGQETMADFSSRGPCEDGRIKPDIVAPGTWIASLRSAVGNDENAMQVISDRYIYQMGTSQAGPHASGAAAVFFQYFKETHTNAQPSPAVVKAALINSALDMADEEGGTPPVPNNEEGWGRIDLTELIVGSRQVQYLDQAVLLTNKQVFTHRIIVGGGEQLKITMTYTDVPGFPGAIPALVNNLDLEVTGPQGQVYHGNQFFQGESIAGGSSRDDINNVEAVHIGSPEPGEYTIKIIAENVVEDSRKDSPATDQDFALVISGTIPLPGHGIIVFDRQAYKVPGQINLRLIDFDLAGQPQATLRIFSSTETNAELLVLKPFGNEGVFTGSVQLVTGDPVRDSRIQVQHGDIVTAEYDDGGELRSGTVRVDINGPLISGLVATNEFGLKSIQWSTDEPATGLVRYGTGGILTNEISSQLFSLKHAISIAGLVQGQTYQFLVISTDQAGNSTTEDNAGNFFTFTVEEGKTVLLVDAYTHNSLDEMPPIPVTVYTDPLDIINASYDVYDVASRGSPSLDTLKNYKVVIWRINDSFFNPENTISPQQQKMLMSYFQKGGGVFIASMELLSRLGDVPFRTNLLQVQSFHEDEGVSGAEGIDGDVVSSDIFLNLNYDAYPSFDLLGIPADVADTIVPVTNSVPIFLTGDGKVFAGVRYPKTGSDSAGRVVFLPFPLDAIPMEDPDPDNRSSLLRRVIGFLAPGANGLGLIAFDKPEYTVPSRATIEVADSDMSGKGSVEVVCYSGTELDGLRVSLSETTRKGLFRGSISLAAKRDANSSKRTLVVAHGDEVWAEYEDQSQSQKILASATIDTELPFIEKVESAPEFGEVTITWKTSKPSDSLVQYGESAFLNLTGYDPTTTHDHEITLYGLQAEKTYYYQVVSTDPAGNTTIDNNGGAFYTFQTFKPLKAPWSDNLDLNSTNWLVLDGEITQVSWELGVPETAVASKANSPPNAWGSNLHGQATDGVQTFLISPAFELSGGNKFTLNFFHNYNFELFDFDIYEYGQLYISTNNGRGWILLEEYGEFSFGWEEEEIDLTAYTGFNIRLGWYYEQFSISAETRSGWLIDDISLSVENVVRSSVIITNNISQARFIVRGAASRTGEGFYTKIDPAAPGEYVVTFQPVPFFKTPTPQTNTLSDADLLFSGIYLINDANQNGISDEWELQYFGAVSGDRSRFTDTDADGQPDHFEFMAGTNPTNAASGLELKAPDRIGTRGVRLQWNSVPGRSYRLFHSEDLRQWRTDGIWTRASGSNTFRLFNLGAANQFDFFRLEVHP